MSYELFGKSNLNRADTLCTVAQVVANSREARRARETGRVSITEYRSHHAIYCRGTINFYAPRRELIATRTRFHASLPKDDRSCGGVSSGLVSSRLSLVRARPAGMPRAGTSKAQYCFFRRFNCLPDARSQSAVESTARPPSCHRR